MRIAAVQMRSGTDIPSNIRSAEALIRKAASAGATLIATPEMTHVLNRKSQALFDTIESESEDLGVRSFSELAKALSIFLLIGSLAIKTGERRAANRSYLFGPEGQILARYDKIHLFDVSVSKQETWMESRIYDHGVQAVTAKVSDMTLGLSICYDLRFAKLYRTYAQAGAQIIAVPAAFTQPTGKAHWETLLKARAIETGSYILAPAQGGTHADGRKTWGHSMIINPWGAVLNALDHDEPGFILADIEKSEVLSARQKIPAWQVEADYTHVHNAFERKT